MNHWLNEGKEILKKGKKKHPYYDSDRKKRTEEFSLKVTAFCIVGMVVILIIAKIFQSWLLKDGLLIYFGRIIMI